MRVLSVCVVVFLICASGLRAQPSVTVDFGQVEVGHDSTIDFVWWPPQCPPPPNPACYTVRVEWGRAFDTRYAHWDTTGGLHYDFAFLFHPRGVGTFTYRVVQGQDDGIPSDSIRLDLLGVGVNPNRADRHFVPPPSSFALSAFPNPFNPQTEIAFSVPTGGGVSVKIFNLQGRQVSVLQEGVISAGEHRVLFDGGQLPAGIYFLRLDAASHQRTLKLVLLK